MRLRYVIVDLPADQGGKQLPMCFSHAWSNDQIKAAVQAAAPECKVVAEGQVNYFQNMISCEGFQPSAFGKISRGRHDEILLESAEHL